MQYGSSVNITGHGDVLCTAQYHDWQLPAFQVRSAISSYCHLWAVCRQKYIQALECQMNDFFNNTKFYVAFGLASGQFSPVTKQFY
jgi:hypothetical protein